MLLITEYGNQGSGRDFRKFHPGAATSKAFLHRQKHRGFQAVDPDKRYMDSLTPEGSRLSFHAGIVFKAFLNH